jgi:hypothetical protein
LVHRLLDVLTAAHLGVPRPIVNQGLGHLLVSR